MVEGGEGVEATRGSGPEPEAAVAEVEKAPAGEGVGTSPAGQRRPGRSVSTGDARHPAPEWMDAAAAESKWAEVPTGDGGVYYYHVETRQVRWERPTGPMALRVEARIQRVRCRRPLPPPLCL